MMTWHGKAVMDRIERQSPSIVKSISTAIADRARRIVAVKTGALRDSIKVTADGIEVGEDYAGAVELGTHKRAAQPFIRPAIEQSSENDLR